MTPKEMDEIFAQHCNAEMAHDVQGILDTLVDDVEHDLVGHPAGVLRDHSDIAVRYQEQFAAITDDRIEPVRRYYGQDFLVDESIVMGRMRGTFMGISADDTYLKVRMLHVCEFRDGKMSRENVWFDVAALLQQLGK